MCGISGIVSLKAQPIPNLSARLRHMNQVQRHRGPNGTGIWVHPHQHVGLGHQRLTIIDLSPHAAQPMQSNQRTVLSFNGEIYNYRTLRKQYEKNWDFKTHSDTETILASFAARGVECVKELRGMFAFALWDEANNRLFCARDAFGIKPFYYLIQDGYFYFASEVKTLLPFIEKIETDESALAEYLTFQYTLSEKTLFKNIHQLLPGHCLIIQNGTCQVTRYWDVRYEIDTTHSTHYFEEKLVHLLEESVDLHLQSDVPVGSYLSGGIDSSLITLLSAKRPAAPTHAFHGRFTDYPGYDESTHAIQVAKAADLPLHICDITPQNFSDHIAKIIYHLDFPVAGPGAFPQYMVSQLAAKHVKVVLGGQGGDELFGGYARYVLAYFEQCIKAAIEGTYQNGNFIVTPESIIPNLTVLKEYKPLIKSFWKEGLFENLDQRYYRLCDRRHDIAGEINWQAIPQEAVYPTFEAIFNNRKNVAKEAYFDSMTHFDFKCLLPALLHVEDRMSMAHGLEARVPLLDAPLVEFAATIPADVKFKDGRMKHLLKNAFKNTLPDSIVNRRDKMGFPVPLQPWFGNELRDFIHDTFTTGAKRHRPFLQYDAILKGLHTQAQFSRKIWGLLSLELWFQQFHDQQEQIKQAWLNSAKSQEIEELV